jgi:hypothetical protein
MKLGKKIHLHHGGHHSYMAIMVAPPQHHDIPQAAHILCNKSSLIKLEYLIFIASYKPMGPLAKTLEILLFVNIITIIVVV